MRAAFTPKGPMGRTTLPPGQYKDNRTCKNSIVKGARTLFGQATFFAEHVAFLWALEPPQQNVPSPQSLNQREKWLRPSRRQNY